MPRRNGDGYDNRYDDRYDDRYDRRDDGYNDRYDRRDDGYDDRYDRRDDGYDDRYDRRDDGYDDRYDRRDGDYDDRNDRRDDGYDDRSDRRLSRYDDRNKHITERDWDGRNSDDEIYSGDEVWVTIDDDIGVTQHSLHRARAYGIVAFLFLVLVIVASVALFISKQSVTTKNMTNCWTWESRVEENISNYVQQNGLSANPAYISDVPGVAGTQYVCKEGGSYTWNPVTGQYVCSVHGHFPEGWDAPQSVVTGQSTTVVSEGDN